MVCYHEIIHTDEADNYYTLVHSEDFEFYEKVGTEKHQIPIGNKILRIEKFCDEDLLELLETNYRSIDL